MMVHMGTDSYFCEMQMCKWVHMCTWGQTPISAK
jgi:hypothetical protein